MERITLSNRSMDSVRELEDMSSEDPLDNTDKSKSLIALTSAALNACWGEQCKKHRNAEARSLAIFAGSCSLRLDGNRFSQFDPLILRPPSHYNE